MTEYYVCEANELAPGTARRVVADGTAIAVVRTEAGDLHAIGDTCTHGDISLAEGFVEGDTLECWAHGSKFSLLTGQPESLPAYEPVPVFHVEEQDGAIYLDTEAQADGLNVSQTA